MKFLAPVIVLVALLQYTAPDGHPMWVARDQIVAITGPTTCGPTANSRLFTANSAVCIKESIDEAVRKYMVEPAK